MNPLLQVDQASLREKTSDLMLATYFKVRQANPQARVSEVEAEAERLIHRWLQECR